MALIIETGAIVANASSFVTLVEFKAYALARGQDLAAIADTVIEPKAVKAMDYIFAREDDLQGDRVSYEQPLPYPRSSVVLYNTEVPITEIPKLVKNLQCQLMLDAYNGVDLMPNATGPAIKREKTGSLETEFAIGNGESNAPSLPAAEAWLKPLLRGLGGFTLSVGRI